MQLHFRNHHESLCINNWEIAWYSHLVLSLEIFVIYFEIKSYEKLTLADRLV